jgi:hypothetical protein
MRWWVSIGNRLVGWVIAQTNGGAMSAALEKYPPRDFEIVRVELASRKRAKS